MSTSPDQANEPLGVDVEADLGDAGVGAAVVAG